MQRRTVVATVVGLVAWPLRGIAQPAGRMARIGFIGGSAPDPVVLRTWVEPLRQGLRELGYVEGGNLAVQWQFADNDPQRLPALAAELAKAKVDLICKSRRPSVR